MGEKLAKHRVICRRCRFRFQVEVAPVNDWRVESQCPSCDRWASFTAADTQDAPQPGPEVLDTEAQRLGELHWRPINEHRSHPAVAWMDRVGNGFFEDDPSRGSWPVPHSVYRFTCDSSAAYIWQEDGAWFVRGWHALRSRDSPAEPCKVFSFEEALDRLMA